jgi:hypothetical protein
VKVANAVAGILSLIARLRRHPRQHEGAQGSESADLRWEKLRLGEGKATSSDARRTGTPRFGCRLRGAWG